MMTIYFILLGSLFYFLFLSASDEKEDKQYADYPIDTPPLPHIKEANQHVR
ncbi:hypothetical protein HP456_12345 [Bacillus haikouensis]|uniref:hypothetical protein n=1 Tax=Bacillus haikouensis TaxID=1510468 RepID=UPI001553920C|nr:hypothetical protein [Bacillus haikouensis]NQD66709.1 hypothetical protein [Bacillus haikouensis]